MALSGLPMERFRFRRAGRRILPANRMGAETRNHNVLCSGGGRISSHRNLSLVRSFAAELICRLRLLAHQPELFPRSCWDAVVNSPGELFMVPVGSGATRL